MVYSRWTEFANHCDSIPVLIDGELKGHLTGYYDTITPGCNDIHTVTIDSLSPGQHLIYVGKCDISYWEMNAIVVAGECVIKPVSQ